MRECASLLLDAGADPNSHTVEWGGEGQMTALFGAVERRDLELARLLIERGAERDEDAFYHACEQGDTAFLDLLHAPGHENLVNHKLDFEDAAGLQWFLEHGVDVNAHSCLHHAIARGRGLTILTMLLGAGADPNRPGIAGTSGAARSPSPPAAGTSPPTSCSRHAVPPPTSIRSTRPCWRSHAASPWSCPRRRRRRWATRPPTITAGSSASSRSSRRTDVVRSLLDAGMPVDTRGWSNFIPLDQAAMTDAPTPSGRSSNGAPT